MSTLSPEAVHAVVAAFVAGRSAAMLASTNNPFDGKNETLRVAFHTGWSFEMNAMEGRTGDRYTVEDLLDLAERARLPRGLDNAPTARVEAKDTTS